jgi:hypothetical protein
VTVDFICETLGIMSFAISVTIQWETLSQ